ncbi:MAG: hypothetical protein U0703_30210, partial [Anaerolineae bacterium]
AIRGFFRRRAGDIVPPNVDKEGEATRTLRLASEWLTSDAPAYAAGLQILERLANLLEAGELVPMRDLPSVKVLALADETDAHRAELRLLIAQWSDTLRTTL